MNSMKHIVHGFIIMFFIGGLLSPLFAFAAEDIFIGPEYRTHTDSYAIVDVEEGSVLLGKNAYEQRPIASLTKLMTAMVALDMKFDFTRNSMYDSDRHYAYRNYMKFRDGDVIEHRDLWASMLIGSMNVPARMIVDSLGVTEGEFVMMMNRKAEVLGLYGVHFEDVHGLSEFNVGNAASVGKMMRQAMLYPEIRNALGTKVYAFNETVSSDYRYQHYFRHTNLLMRKRINIPMIASKTGYLDEAGPCLSFVTELSGEEVVVVTLGERSWNRRHDVGYKLAMWFDDLTIAQRQNSDAFLVKYPGDPRVYEVTAGGPKWIPSEAVFLSKGYRWDQIMEIGLNDRVRLGLAYVL